MKRREFIQCAIATLCLWSPWQQASSAEGFVQLLPAAEGDLAGEESERGFMQALGRLPSAFPRTGHTVVVPSASALGGNTFSRLIHAARQGVTVLIDLADGFAASSDLARTRKDLYRHFGIEIAHPVKYSSGDYILYRWPIPAQVRHFTRISYIQPSESKVIAHLGFKPIAVRKEIGLGSVVIFGSALGSLLLAGDEQAHEIFTGLLSVNCPNAVNGSTEEPKSRGTVLFQ
jgi:hypothetical protein